MVARGVSFATILFLSPVVVFALPGLLWAIVADLTSASFAPNNDNNKNAPPSQRSRVAASSLFGGRMKGANSSEHSGNGSIDSSSNGKCIAEATENKMNIAFLGNSMQYFHDCPRLLQQMITGKDSASIEGIAKQVDAADTSAAATACYQNSCLRGGVCLQELWEKGNGMREKFGCGGVGSSHDGDDCNGTVDDIGAGTVQELLEERDWDCIVLNDFTKHPARTETRDATLQILKEKYSRYFFKPSSSSSASSYNNNAPTVIFIQTPAYKYPKMRGTEDLGDFDEFTDRLAAGCQAYVDLVNKEFISTVASGNKKTEQQPQPEEGEKCHGQTTAVVAPVGEAYRWLYHNDKPLWERLYHWDDFHPSPSGTWLQACVLYCTIMKHHHKEKEKIILDASSSSWPAAVPLPPSYNAAWWERSRYRPPDPLPNPTKEQAAKLRKVACHVCNVVVED